MAYKMNLTGEELSEGLKVLSSQEVKDGFSSINVKELMDNFLDVVKNKYFCFEGTTGRKVFWRYYLAAVAICFVVAILGAILSIVLSFVGLAFIGSLIFMLAILALICPTAGIAARRLHDIGKSGWLQVIPFVGLILCLLPSKKGCDCGCNCGCEQK